MRPWLVVLLIAACETNAAPPRGTPRPVSTPAPVTAVVRDAPAADAHPGTLPGEQVYLALCAQCHGKDLKGYVADNAPSMVSPTFLESATDDFLRASISACASRSQMTMTAQSP